MTGDAGFTRVLVYDVSRWGRFQDADESAHYEFVCRSAGFQVEYCAEQFVNDGSPMSSIVKSIKRVMAGEFSRELSEKVFAGQVSGLHVTRTSPVKVNVGQDLPVLFASLTRRGGRTNWRFNIDSDVEVIIAMRHGWGDPCPELFLFPRRSFPHAQSCAAWQDSPSPLDQFRTNLHEAIEALRHWKKQGKGGPSVVKRTTKSARS